MKEEVMLRCIFIFLGLLHLLWPLPLKAQTPVGLELVMAIDTSESVDGFEFNLMLQGMADAFRHPEVIELVELHDGIAVMLFQWNSQIDPRYRLPWRLLRNGADCLAFAHQIEAFPRDPHRGFTAIGEALRLSVESLESNAYEGLLKKIDIAGDGRSNSGIGLTRARAMAERRGIQVNGLPIHSNTYSGPMPLERYYQDEVIVGPGAFVSPAQSYGDFARAFLDKLIREMTPTIAQAPNARPQMTARDVSMASAKTGISSIDKQSGGTMRKTLR